MNKEKWNIYSLSEKIPARLYFDELLHKEAKLLIKLSGENANEIQVNFLFDEFFSYRFADEGDLLKTLPLVAELTPWPLFIVDNSNYLAWFLDQSCDMHQNQKLFHYVVSTPNEIIDVISLTPPKVCTIEKNKRIK